MKERELTLGQVSRLTGVPKSTVKKIKNGKSDPKISTLIKLAIGLSIKVRDLVDSDDV